MERKKFIDKKNWLPLSFLVIVGSIPGVILLKKANTTSVKLFMGIVIISIGIEMLFHEGQKERKQRAAILVIVGVITGFLCGLFGIGALLAAYVGRTTKNNDTFRGNLCLVFLIENTFRIFLYCYTGIITISVIKLVIILLPFMLMGLFIGNHLSKILNEKLIKKVVVIMLIVSGVSLLVKNSCF